MSRIYMSIDQGNAWVDCEESVDVLARRIEMAQEQGRAFLMVSNRYGSKILVNLLGVSHITGGDL